MLFSIPKHISVPLRGVAILLVLSNHFVAKLGLTPGTILGATGVSIFFLLSGYGLQESFLIKGREKFWERKLLKVWLPYICLSIPILLYEVQNESILLIFLKDFLLIKPYYYYGWYLSALAVFYASFYLSTWLKNERLFFFFWLFFIVVVLLFMHNLAKVNGIVFVIGIYISKLKNKHIAVFNRPFLIITLIILLLLSVSAYSIIPIESDGGFFRCQIIQVLLSLFIVIWFVMSNSSNFILSLFGTISYELYIVHGWILEKMGIISFKDCIWLVPTIFLASFCYFQLWKFMSKSFCKHSL